MASDTLPWYQCVWGCGLPCATQCSAADPPSLANTTVDEETMEGTAENKIQ